MGEEWYRFTPEQASKQPWLVDAVRQFRSYPVPAGDAATAWLQNQALSNHPLTVTWLVVLDREVHGYYALASCQVALRTRDRKKLGLAQPTQGACLLAWMAKACGSPLDGETIFLHALANAREVGRIQGQGFMALDPYDEESAAVWRETKYGFRPSADNSPGKDWKRLWRPLTTDL